METPLYTKLLELSQKNPLRFHIPGHKGKALFPQMSQLDFTELSATGNLYGKGDEIAQAQALWAVEFGFPYGQFLTGGSTQGVYTALALCCKEGDSVLLDRGAHRSASHAMALLGLNPVYLPRPWLPKWEVPSAVDPDQVEELLTQHPDIKTVFLTSPTTEGVLSDVYSVSELIHRRGGKLIVDGAHGAHLPWLMIDNYSSADVVCVSAHKTLPALGQSSLIFFKDFLPQEVQEVSSRFGSSSPSFLLMASMDYARAWMNEDGMMEYVRVARNVATLREIFPSLNEPLYLDPCRLCVLCPHGDEVAEKLEQEQVYLEMAGKGHLVGVFTAQDSDEDIHKLGSLLVPHLYKSQELPDLSPPHSFPEQAMSLRQVLFAPKVLLPLKDCCGRIAAANIAPFPPGVPVVVMGETIRQEDLAYLQRIGYEKDEILVVL